MRPIIHLILHVLVPGAAARLLFKRSWRRGWMIMVATMTVDLDHLLASPVFDPERCSIGFHPLHTYPAIALYVVLAVFPKTRLIGLGLVIHMALDGLDCASMAFE